MNALTVLWLFPDMLNLHGDRGNLMALQRAAGFLGLSLDIRRIDSAAQPLPLEEADLLILNAGELRCAATIAAQLTPQRQHFLNYADHGKVLLAIGSSGAILARETALLDGGSFAGLGLLDMVCREREQVYGDDISFELLPEGLEILGNQIQVMDTHLLEGQAPLGRLTYGRGNENDRVKSGGADEGARRQNIIFTNTLGPLLVKNPRLAALLLQKACLAKGLPAPPQLDEQCLEWEDRSAELIRAFIRNKQQ